MKTMAFLGDSITYGAKLPNISDRFGVAVSEHFGYLEENYGIPGSLLAKAGMNETNGESISERVKLILDADFAVIFGGTNDYFWTNHPMEGNDMHSFEFALDYMLKECHDKRKKGTTLVVTPYPHNGFGNFKGGKDPLDPSTHDTSEPNFVGHSLPDYVALIEKYANKYELDCINLHKDFYFDWKIHTIDGCHPNKEGHKLIAEALIKKIETML